jgi:hypothetical protein
MDKVLGGPARPSGALALYAASGVLAFLYRELDALVVFERENGEGWFGHSLRTVDALPSARPVLRWAALLAGIGEPEEPMGAGEEGAPPNDRALLRTVALLTRLRSSNARVTELAELTRWIARPPSAQDDDATLRRFLAGAGRARLRPLLRIWSAEVRADQAWHGAWTEARLRTLRTRLRAIARSGAPLSLEELAFSGRDLIAMGHSPGPHFGEVLAHLLDRVLESPSRNQPEVLAAEASAWLEGHGKASTRREG